MWRKQWWRARPLLDAEAIPLEAAVSWAPAAIATSRTTSPYAGGVTEKREGGQRPLKRGSRFSRNAAIASCVSAVEKLTVCPCASASSASASVVVNDCCSNFLLVLSAI